MLVLPPPPVYSHFAEDAVVDVTPAEDAHASPSDSSSDSSHSSADTFTNTEDTGGASNYHASYPFWVYSVHPSTQCETTNQNCPPVNKSELANYNQQQHKKHVHELIVGLIIGILIIGFGIMLYRPVDPYEDYP